MTTDQLPIGDASAEKLYLEVGRFLSYWEDAISQYNEIVGFVIDRKDVNFLDVRILKELSMPHKQLGFVEAVIEASNIFRQKESTDLKEKIIKNINKIRNMNDFRNNIAHGVVGAVNLNGVEYYNLLLPPGYKSTSEIGSRFYYAYNSKMIQNKIEILRDLRWAAIEMKSMVFHLVRNGAKDEAAS